MKPRAGEVWLADLGLTAKTRPVAIVSRDDPDPPRALMIYIPLTSQSRGSSYEVPLGHLRWLSNETVANVQGIGSLPIPRFQRKLGLLPQADLDSIRAAIALALELQTPAT